MCIRFESHSLTVDGWGLVINFVLQNLAISCFVKAIKSCSIIDSRRTAVPMSLHLKKLPFATEDVLSSPKGGIAESSQVLIDFSHSVPRWQRYLKQNCISCFIAITFLTSLSNWLLAKAWMQKHLFEISCCRRAADQALDRTRERVWS